MSNKLLYIYKLLVFTKRLVFKHFLSKILFFATVLLFLSSFNSPYPEPTYYEINFGDGVTHLWSRSVYYDNIGFDKVNKKVTDKYNNLPEKEITFFWARRNYLDTRDAHHEETNRKMDSIMDSIDKIHNTVK